MGKGLIWLGNKIAALWVKSMKIWNKGISYLMFNGVGCCCRNDRCCCKNT